MPSTRLALTPEQRAELERRDRSRRGRADAARRAQVILLLADGDSYATITAKTGRSSRTIALWRHRFEASGLDGLLSKRTVLTPALQARILAWARRAPPHGATHWSTQSLDRRLGVQHTIVARAWREAGLQPYRLERYMRSTDPDFETKAADVIGLYLEPPQHAVVFCVDEKPAIQALDRIDPILPLSPDRAERHGFEYYRHGTLSLYAALNTHTGEVLGSAVPRHTSDEFVAFLTSVVETQPRRREIHIIVDNRRAGRLSHQVFRGLLRVRCALQPAGSRA
jgi:transposase